MPQRQSRPMIVGRKIWLSAGSDQGGHRVASIFGLIVTAKLIGVDPETLAGIALDTYRAVETRTVVFTCFGLAGAPALMPALVWSRRNRLPEEADAGGGLLRAFSLLLRPRFCLGALCDYPYVGAEVAIGSLIVSYLAQPGVLGVTDLQAGKRVPLYWGGALAGRFVGAYVLGRVSPGNVLTAVAAGAIALILVSANTTGALSAWSLLTTALWNSIMFPTIFSLASEGLGRRAAEGRA